MTSPSSPSPLIMFALDMESCGLFDGHRLVHCGVGKVNAAYALTRAIYQQKPSHVINLGSAGSAVHKAGSVLCCTGFVQRDMDVTPLGFAAYVTPFAKPEIGGQPVLTYGQAVDGMDHVICGTGDNFDTAHKGDIYEIVDMEAYALAQICARENIPFTCLKFISDGADGAAADDWDKALHDGAYKLKLALDNLLRA